jgi:Fe-S cluster biogenesis protein NfuA
MLGLGIRSAIKAQVKRLLGREPAPAVRPPTPPPNRYDVAPGDKPRPPREYDVRVADSLGEDDDGHGHSHSHGHSHGHSHDHDEDDRKPPVSAAPSLPRVAPEPVAPAAVAAPSDDAGEKELTPDAIEAVLDAMVRPALQADGGDIAFVKVEANDVYVRLVGSCSSCPSSILTMKMGVERLLQEEFPAMGALIQVEDPPATA